MNSFAAASKAILSIRKQLEDLEMALEKMEADKEDAIDKLFKRLQLPGTYKKTTKFKKGEKEIV